MINDLTFILVLISVYGTYLNLKQNYKGFYWWAFSDLFWAFYNLKIKAFWEAVLMFIYTGLSVWGLIEWKKKTKKWL